MKKGTILHAIAKQLVRNWRTLVSSAAYSSAFGSALTLRFLCGNEITSHPSRHYGSFPTSLRLVVTLLLMLVVGVNTAWGQVYSGTYYIASDYETKAGSGIHQYDVTTLTNNFYLCPTEGWISFGTSGENNDTWTTGDDKPFLTTYKARLHANDQENPYDITKAKWTIEYYTTESGKDYYYIKHSSGKYMVLNKKIDGMQGNTPENRIRVHLEKLTSEQLEVAATRNLALFAISPNGRSIIIYPKTQSAYHLTVNNGNGDYLYGNGNNKGTITSGSTTYGMEGTIGIYSPTNDATQFFYLEEIVPRPTIGYDASGNNITITNPYPSSSTVYYTTDGSDPMDSGNTKRLSFTEISQTFEFTNVNVADVKAVAYINGEYSNIAKSVYVHIGDNPYLLQNVENTNFYMTVGDVDNNSNTTVNTSSLPQAGMSWYFSDAGSVDGVQYYYITNGSPGGYLYFNNGNVYLKTYSDYSSNAGDDGYKFFIVQGFGENSSPDGFHIVPKAQISDNTYCIFKGGWTGTSTIANSKADAVKGSTNARRPEQKHTRWNFVQPNTLNKTAPFTVSDASTHITKFYKIASVGSSGYYIVPPTGTNTNATTSNSTTAATMKSGTWYFEVAQEPILTHEDPTKIDWCTYYYIRNAETGKYLYFIRDANNAGACLEMRSTIESGQEDRYMFTWAKTAATVANYYIVPKKLKDASQNNISSLRKNDNNTNIVTNITRGAGNFAWTFEDADLFCSNPVFDESGENIVISCIPGSAEIRYTTNGDDPSADGATYSVYTPTTPFSKSDQHLIKACAVVSDGATPTPNTASSDVITFIKNPDITFTEGNELPYAGGSAVKPTVSSVTITPEGGSTFTIDATEYSVAFSNNTEVGIGTAIVTISDALPENNTIISGTSHFTITPKSLGNGTTAADGITITLTKIGENEYSVTVKNGTTTLTQYDANNPTASYDYTVSGTPDESGFVATVEAKKEGDVYTGNYTGKAKAVYVKANFPTLTSETDGGSAAAYQATTNLAAPPDLKACVVTGVDYNAGIVEVQELAYIPEGVPVLLLTEGDAPHNADFTATVYTVESGSEADVTSNKLRRSGGDVSADWGQYYIFSKGEFVLSMGDKTIKEGKYYFENEKYVSGSSPAPAPSRLYISRRGATRIHKVVDNIYLTDSWYTLNGQKLNKKPTRKGIYMQNGKKVVIK